MAAGQIVILNTPQLENAFDFNIDKATSESRPDSTKAIVKLQ